MSKAATEPKLPDEWKDDLHVIRASGKEHDKRRDCWCNPKVVGLPALVKGSSEPVDTVQVLHR